MKVVELVGKDIMKAYDGRYLSEDFGYSCANFNMSDNGSGNSENDVETFDFYTLNPNNISCFVCYDEYKKICGRRMFFKGKSLLNHRDFQMPYEMGTQVRYLYGYYGAHDNVPYKAISNAAIAKYGDRLIHTDKFVLKNGKPDYTIDNYFIFQVERADFQKYPPIDHLQIAPTIQALSNFDPSVKVIEILERDLNVKKITFHHAYRYNPNKGRIKYNYSTWDQHHGNVADDNKTTVSQDEDDDVHKFRDFKIGDKLKVKNSDLIFTIVDANADSVTLDLGDGRELEFDKDELDQFFDI